MTCPKCNTEVPEKSKFCPNCGAKIKSMTQSDNKKKIWIGIGIGAGVAVIIALIVVLSLTLVHNQQAKKQGNPGTTAAAISQSTLQKENASSETTYVSDPSVLTKDYLGRYYEDVLGKANVSVNSDLIEEVGFSVADDVNHVKPGHTHNSLCYVVNLYGLYRLYEYSDIKIDGNGNLLPATYKGVTKTFQTEEEMRNYLSDKPTDTYHYTLIQEHPYYLDYPNLSDEFQG